MRACVRSKTKGEVRLDDNKIGIVRRSARQCHWLGCMGAPMSRALSRPQHKVIAPLAETVEAHSRVWVSLPIARPTQTGQTERGLLSNLRVIWGMPVKPAFAG